MIEESGEHSHQGEASDTTPEKMAEALDAMKASSPSLAEAIEEADITPGELASSRHRATSDEHDAAAEPEAGDRQD